MATKTTTQVTKISIEDIEKVYNGAQGCACGCGGDYIYNTPENIEAVTKLVNRINARLKSNPDAVDVEFVYASIEGTTKATRIYFRKGISYNNMFGTLERAEEIAAA